MRITANTDRESLRSGWGAGIRREDLRVADARRTRLQRLARINSNDYGTTLSLDPSHETAHVVQQPGEDPEVVITGRELAQPVTDYEGETWDWMAQKALTMHETGHILYTDSEDFQARLSDIDASQTGVAKSLWNALEDGAIEAQIRGRWPNYSVPLLHLRANMFLADDHKPGFADPERGGRVIDLAGATMTACLDLATFDSGTLRQALDPSDDEYHFATAADAETFRDDIVPVVRDAVPDVLGEPNPVDRNARIFQFITTVLPLIEDGDADGQAQSDGSAGGMPDDADGGSGAAQADADELGDETSQAAADRADDVADAEAPEDVPNGGAPIDPSDDDEGDSAAAGDAVDDDSDEGADGDDETEDDPLATDPDVADEYSDDVADQRIEESGGSESMMDELETLRDTLQAGGELQATTIQIPESATGDRARFDRYKQGSRRFEQLLRQRLQKERKSRTKRGQRRGRIDSTALHRVAQGESRVKMRESDPDEKDYAFAIVVDRSTSMSGGQIADAEETVVTTGCALEAVGCDVMVVDMLSNEASLAKPFGVDMEARADHLTTGTAKGGTPLSGTLRLARERLKRYQTTARKAVMVITDGQPSNPEEYAETLAGCTFPVIGVQIADEDGAGSEHYHRSVVSKPGTGDLQTQLQRLVQEAMFL